MPIRIKPLGPCAICGKMQWDEVHRLAPGTDVRGIKAHQFVSKPR